MPTAIPGKPVGVADACAIAAVLFVEPEAGAVLDRLEGVSLAAPTLFAYELANICLKKLRRHPAQRSQILYAWSRRHDLVIELHPVDQGETFALAEHTGLTAYDAAYLWLARRLNAPLVTLDRRLAEAAATP